MRQGFSSMIAVSKQNLLSDSHYVCPSVQLCVYFFLFVILPSGVSLPTDWLLLCSISFSCLIYVLFLCRLPFWLSVDIFVFLSPLFLSPLYFQTVGLACL